MFGGLQNLFGGQVKSAAGNAEAALEEQRTGRKPISFEIQSVNFEHLRRKRAFYKGVDIQLQEEKDKEKTLDFTDLPDIIPVKAAKQGYADLDYDTLAGTTKSEEEQKSAAAAASEAQEMNGDAATTVGKPYTPPSHLFDYDNSSDQERTQLLDRLELIMSRQIKYREQGTTDVKMVAIIVNTYCGRGAGIMDELGPLLETEMIPHEVHLTEAALDPYRLAQTLDLGKYAVLAIAGGDTTINEVVNGMLAREDKVRIPIAIIPNGSNNDIAASLGIYNMNIAVDYLQQAEAIAIDTVRMLIDRDDEEGLPQDETRLNHARHMLSGSSLSMPAKIDAGASGMKGMCGQSSYSISSYFQALTCGFVQDTYDVEIDDKKFSSEGTTLMCINNSKNTTGGMIINPFAILNDGLIDITWVTDPAWKGTFGTQGIISNARSGGGVQAYQGHSTYMRGRKIKVHFKDKDEEAEPELSTETGEVQGAGSGPAQVVAVDGTDLNYYGSITWECIPSNIEVIVNTTSYFLDSNAFEKAIDNQTKESRIINQIVDQIWLDFDKDKNGYLDRAETKVFLQTVLKDAPSGERYDESKFDDLFDTIDQNGDGLMEKAEMRYFIRVLLKSNKA